MNYYFIKRWLDFIIALFCIVILAPLYLLIIIINMLVHGRPVFFTQTRPGLQGNPFTFYKFRTMTQEKNEKGELLLDKDRITKFGSFLRKTSLDELPSLWNVLKGDMSLVGPRADRVFRVDRPRRSPDRYPPVSD